MPTEPLIASSNGIEICYETFGDPRRRAAPARHGPGRQLIVLARRALRGARRPGLLRHPVRQPRHAGSPRQFEAAGGDFLMSRSCAPRPGRSRPRCPTCSPTWPPTRIGLLDALGIDSAHVVGASMGGMIAQTIAIEHPGRVRTLTSIMSTTGEPDVGQPDARGMAGLLAARAHHPRGGHRGGVASPAADRRAPSTSTRTAPAGWPPRRTTAATTPPASPDTCSPSLRRAAGRTDSRQLQVPALVIHGDVDPLVTPSGGQRTAELVPGAELLVLEGMGHDLPPRYLGPIVEAITSLASSAAHA